jgi:DNA mismatch repair ATPase MutS
MDSSAKRETLAADINADAEDVIIITAANDRGKSTFLRSVGLAQLMRQAGMFVLSRSSQPSHPKERIVHIGTW